MSRYSLAFHVPSVEHVALPKNRLLAFEEYGDPDGFPLLFFHGVPGSRVMGRVLADAAADLGVRVLSTDRPGIGASSYQLRRRIRDWPEDVAALAVVLQLEEFAVLGRGGGAAYALACAHDFRDRLVRTGLVSPVPPPSVVRAALGRPARYGYDLRRWLPLASLLRVRRLAADLARDPDAFGRDLVDAAPPRDRDAYRDREVRRRRREAHAAAFRQGTLGPLRDHSLQDRGWGFRLEGVTRHVHLWHGRRDPVTPVARAERVAERLPECSATFYEEDGHVSVLVDHGREVLAALVP